MSIDRKALTATVTGMQRLSAILLIPFWCLGYSVALIVILVLFLWHAGTQGWQDSFARFGANR